MRISNTSAPKRANRRQGDLFGNDSHSVTELIHRARLLILRDIIARASRDRVAVAGVEKTGRSISFMVETAQTEGWPELLVDAGDMLREAAAVPRAKREKLEGAAE